MSLSWRSHTADVISGFPEAATALRDATIIVTGPTAGIGVHTATALAQLGGRVILAARNGDKAEEVAGQIRGRYPSAALTWLPLDLSSLESCRGFAERFVKESKENGWPPLKLLVLNAGMFSISREYAASADGYERTFAINHLGHYLLTLLLLPQLRAAAPSRVVVVASESHRGPLLTNDVTDVDALRRTLATPDAAARDAFGYLAGLRAYGSSKLANVCFARSLNNKLAAEGVTSCSLHPGTLMMTDIARDSRFARGFFWLLSWVTKDLDQGSSTTLVGCFAPSERLPNYFNHCQPQRESTSVNEASCEALWNLSASLCADFLPHELRL